jgi:hypothetical protein
MTKIIRTAARVTEKVVHGFAQMGSLGHSDVRAPAPKKTVTEALRGDWVRLGGDMERAIEKVKASGSSR